MNHEEWPENLVTSRPGSCAESTMTFGYRDELGNLQEEVTHFKSCIDENGIVTSVPLEDLSNDGDKQSKEKKK